MGDILISSLAIGICGSTMCVRASRFWDFYDTQDETKLLHSYLVLIDEEGNSVHAQIYPNFIETFRPMIKEGSVYNLSYVLVKKSNKMYKPVENDMMINFTEWTTLEEVSEIPPAFPVYTYTLTHMENIPSLVDYKEHFIDVIGGVTATSSVSSFRSRARQTESLKRTVTIRNASNATLDIVLWGERATSFPAEQVHKAGQNSPQIIIFVGTLVKSYADNVSLSGGSTCKWYINPEVPEAKSLMASLGSMHQAIKLDQQMAYSQPKAFAPEHKKNMEWLVTVKVMKIDNSWSYNSCKKCLKTSKTHGDTYKCSNRQCAYIGTPNPRYKLEMIAGDDTGDTEFMLFGRTAQRIIKKTVDDLIADNPVGFIPDDITRLLEKVYTFNVSFTENTITSGNVSFQVNAVVAEIDDGKPLPVTPAGTQSSSIMLTQAAGSSMQGTPLKDTTFSLPSPAAPSEASHASSTTSWNSTQR